MFFCEVSFASLPCLQYHEDHSLQKQFLVFDLQGQLPNQFFDTHLVASFFSLNPELKMMNDLAKCIIEIKK